MKKRQTVLGGSLLLLASAAEAQHLRDALTPTAFLAIPAGLGISAVSEPILNLLFANRPAEIAAAAKPLEILGIAMIFAALTFPLMSLLQGAGAAGSTLRVMLIGAAVKLTGILLLTKPLGLCGIALSTLLCDLAMLLLKCAAFRRHVKIPTHLLRISLPCLIAGCFCSVTARYSYPLLLMHLPQKLAVLTAVFLGSGIYLLVQYCIKKQAPAIHS